MNNPLSADAQTPMPARRNWLSMRTICMGAGALTIVAALGILVQFVGKVLEANDRAT